MSIKVREFIESAIAHTEHNVVATTKIALDVLLNNNIIYDHAFTKVDENLYTVAYKLVEDGQWFHFIVDIKT